MRVLTIQGLDIQVIRSFYLQIWISFQAEVYSKMIMHTIQKSFINGEIGDFALSN